MATAAPTTTTPLDVLNSTDSRTTALNYRNMGAGSLSNLIRDLIVRLKDTSTLRDLNALSSVKRTSAYARAQQEIQKESTLLMLIIKDPKLKQITNLQDRIQTLKLISDLVMIYLDKYYLVIKNIPKIKLVGEKLSRDLFFHLVKRLPDFYKEMQNAKTALDADNAYSDALMYLRSSSINPLTKFVSVIVGELTSGVGRQRTDRNLFIAEQEKDVASLKEDFKKNKTKYAQRWSLLRNEAIATLTNLDIEIGGSVNSPKTIQVLKERRARLDGFLYSVEQGLQSIKVNNFAGFVTSKISIEDSLVEYSKRLEFRSLVRINNSLTSADKTDSKNKDRGSSTNRITNIFNSTKKSTKRESKFSSGPRFNKSMYRYLGPAGLLLYAGHNLVFNRATIGTTKFLAKLPFKASWLVGKGLVKGGMLVGRGMGKAYSFLRPYASAAYREAGIITKVKLVDPAIAKISSIASKVAAASPSLASVAYQVGRLAGSSYRKSKNFSANQYKRTSGLVSSIVRRSKSLISGLVSSYSGTQSPTNRQDPDFSVAGPTQNQPGPINNLPTAPNQSATKNQERRPSTDPWILDVLDYILDKKLPHEPGPEDAITEKDLEIFKDDIVDELEDFLNGLMEDKIKEMRSSIIPKIGSLVDPSTVPSVESTVSTASTQPTTPTTTTTTTTTTTPTITTTSTPTSTPTSTVTPAPSVHPTVDPPKPARTPAEEKIEKMRARQRKVSEQIAARNIEQQRIKKELEDLQKQIDDKIRVEAALSASNVTGSRRASVDYLREVYREKKERLKTIIKSKYERSVEKLKTIRAYADVLRQKKAGVPSSQGIVRNLIGRSPLSQSTLLRTIQLGSIKATAETSSGQQPAVGAGGSNPLERARSATSETSRKELFRILRDLAKPKSEGLISRFIKGLISSGPRLARMVGSMASGLGRFFAPAMSALATVAPFLARAALPLVAVAGSALAGWKLGSALYEKYSAEIVDGIEYVVKQANRIVDGAKAAYEWLVETVKNPGARLSEIKDKIKAWASSSPTLSSIGNAVKNAPSKVVAAAKSAASSAAAAASSAGKAVVDSVSTAASGAKSYVSDKLGRLFGTNHSRVDFDGLNPATRSSFEAMAAEYRESGGKKPLNIESARRSTEQQQKLYEQNPSVAAKPGRSLHERGMALDIDRATAGELESLGLLKKYGFQRNVRGEPWHLSHDGNLYGKPTSVVAKDAASKSSVAPQQTAAAPATPSTAAPSSSKKPSANTVPAQEKTVDTTSAPAPAEKPKVSAPPAPVAAPAPTKSASNSIPTFSYDDPTMFIMNTGILA